MTDQTRTRAQQAGDAAIYGSDSLWTLSGAQVMGVLALSLGQWGLVIWAQLRARPLRRPLRMAVACTLFAGFVWLSPQVYYLFYWVSFDGLPWQSVLKTPPSPLHLLRLLSFSEEASLSRHGQGLLGWSLLLLAWRSPGAGDRP